jgi:hypothetical protein
VQVVWTKARWFPVRFQTQPEVSVEFLRDRACVMASPEVMQAGQHVVAKVPYTKRADEWILATVRHHVPDTEQYMVKDLHPDSSKKVWPLFLHTPGEEALVSQVHVLSRLLFLPAHSAFAFSCH